MLFARDDLAVALDRHRPFVEREVREQPEKREAVGDDRVFAVEDEPHVDGRSAKSCLRARASVRFRGNVMSRRRIIVSSVVGTFVLGALACAVGARFVGVTGELPPGVTIEGGRPPKGMTLGTWLEAKRAAQVTEETSLFHEGRWWFVPNEELGVELDVAQTIDAAKSASRSSVLTRMLGREETVDVPYVFRLDEKRAEAKLGSLAPDVKREPVNARFELASHTTVREEPGAELDVAPSVADLRKLPHRAGDVLALRTKAIAPAITTEALGNIDLSKVLAAQETTFTLWGTGYGRMVNIRTAAAKLDGVVLGPGETLSFNQVVGERTVEAGFTMAPEIVDDELQDGIGGGTCQVASTLHAATVFGALEIVERQSHSRPSSYVQPGLDATVAWGKVDLKIRNNRSEPVLIHAYLPKPTSIRVELLGAQPTVKVDYRWGSSGHRDFWRRVTQKGHFSAGKVVRKQKGKKGFHATSVVTTTLGDGTQTERMWHSEYRPVPEVFWVGPGFDEAELGELPEGATRVQYRGIRKPPATPSVGDNG